jgi:hypothetical protein
VQILGIFTFIVAKTVKLFGGGADEKNFTALKTSTPPKKRQNKAKEEGFHDELACLFACLFILRN